MEATKSTVPYSVFVPFWDHPYRRLLLPFYSVLPAVKSKKSNVKHSYRNWCLEINKIVPTADDIVKKSSYRTGSNPETWWCPWQIYSVWLSQMQREIKQTILAVHIMILTSMIVIMKLTQNCKSRQKKKKKASATPTSYRTPLLDIETTDASTQWLGVVRALSLSSRFKSFKI